MNNKVDFNRHLKGTQPRRVEELPPGTPIHVDLNNATLLTCECGCSKFIPAIQIYRVSAIISPTGTEQIANQQVIICAECKKAFTGK